MCVYLLKALRMQMWLQSRRVPLPEECRASMLRLLSAHGIKQLPDVWLIHETSQPFVWGLYHGSIYLPSNLVTAREPTSWTSVLGHELSHVIPILNEISVSRCDDLEVLGQ
jgi:beta-lactamase regulating signal transducer with metallopeptidase domain